MAVFGGLWDVVTVVFLVLVFAEYTKLRARTPKAFNFVAASGVLVLLAAASDWLGVAGPLAVQGVSTLFSVIAWILLLIGTLWAAYELTKSK